MRFIVCLAVCAGLILGCFPTKADAVAVESFVTLGIAACLILMSAGIIFHPQTLEDVKSIGQTFQNHLTEWGDANDKRAEIDDCIESIVIVNPFGSPDDGGWNSPTEQQLIIAGGLLNAFTTFVAKVALGLKKIEDTSQTAPLAFRYLRIKSSYNDGYKYFFQHTSKVAALLQSSYYNNLLVVFSGDDEELFGWFWKDGFLKTGIWKNPDGVIHASDFGVYPAGTLELVLSVGTEVPICFSKDIAESRSDYLTADYLVIDWEQIIANSALIASKNVVGYRKYSYNSTWNNNLTQFDCFHDYIFQRSVYTYYPDTTSDVVWDDVAVIEPDLIVGDIVQDLESGELSEEEIPLQNIDYSLLFPAGQSPLQSLQNVVQQFYGGDMTLEKYLELTKTADYGAAVPSVVVNIPMNNSITYYQNAVPSAINVLATSPDGGTISYEWYRYGTDANGKVYPVEVLDTDSSFLPLTDQLGTSHYYCRIYNTDPSGMVNYVHTPSIKIEIVADPNAGTVTKPDVGTDTEANKALADAIGQSVSDALKNQNNQSSQDAMNTGNDVSQDLLDAVPDHSTKFLPYIRDLANSMGYTGTTCVLTMPAITVPAVGTHFNAITVLDEQQINFEDYFNKMPELIMTIVRAIFDIAVVFFCLREFNHTIQQVLTGFKDMKDDLEDF